MEKIFRGLYPRPPREGARGGEGRGEGQKMGRIGEGRGGEGEEREGKEEEGRRGGATAPKMFVCPRSWLWKTIMTL
jgi:hypothetical protein